MGQIVEAKGGSRRRRNKYIWMLSAVAAVSALLYWEQTALLYVISTLVLTGLLLVVAFSDLEGRDRELNKAAEPDGATITVSKVSVGASASALADAREIRRREGAA
ncbi:MAG: hypothetical protein ACREBG_30175 [Pyrinomonadaceae bacterium]